MPYFLETGLSKAEILRFFEFSKWPPLPSCFFEREILLAIGVQKVQLHQQAKLHQNRSIDCQDIKIFRFFKMAAVRHFGFVWGIFGPSTVRKKFHRSIIVTFLRGCR